MPFVDVSEDGKSLLNSRLIVGDTETDFGQNYDAALEDAWHNHMSISKTWYTNKNQDELLAKQFDEMRSNGYGFEFTYGDLNKENSVKDDPMSDFNIGAIDKFNKAVDELRKRQPEKEWLTYEEIGNRALEATKEQAKEARITHEDIATRQGTGGFWGDMAGAGVGAMSDPINIALTAFAAPLAMETWGMAILGNAAINTAGEVGVQFAPGGVRQWLGEQGMTPDQVNAETASALIGTAAGGAVLGGLIKGGGDVLKVLGRKVLAGSQMEQRAAVAELMKAENFNKLTPEQQDALKVIQAAQQVEDSAAWNVLNTKFSNFDGEQLLKNIDAVREASRALYDDTFTPNNLVFNKDTIAALNERTALIDSMMKELDGPIDRTTLDDLMATVLSEDRYAHYQGLVDQIRNGETNRLAGLRNAERIVADDAARKAGIVRGAGDDAANLARKQEALAKMAKDVEDANAILRDLEAKKANIEKQIIAVHDGKYGNLDKAQVDQVHAEFRSQLEAVQKDIDSFAKERDALEASRADYQKSVGKTERRVANVNERITTAEAETNMDLNVNRDHANTVNKAEASAAREVLTDLKLVSENQARYAKLMASNPRATPSEMRQIVALGELQNRMKFGEHIVADDVRGLLDAERLQKFEDAFTKTNDLERAVDSVIADETRALGEKGQELFDQVSRNINEIIERFGEDAEPRQAIKALAQRINAEPHVDPKMAIEQTAKLADDKVLVDKHMQAIRDNLNNDMVVYVDPESGKQYTMADIYEEVQLDEKFADIVKKCPY